MKATLTIGVSGSGKTHWATQQKMRVISRDDIRREILGLDYKENLWAHWKFNKKSERKVTDIQYQQIQEAAASNQDIIIADTNINPKTRQKLTATLQGLGYKVEEKVFKTSVWNCLSNNFDRVDEVPESVIWDQWQSLNIQCFLNEDIIPTDRVVVCDIDGTIAAMGERSPYDYTKVHLDTVRREVALAALGICEGVGAEIVFVSGRELICRRETYDWLSKNVTTEFTLFMRPIKDNRPDTEIKREIYETFLEDKEIVAVFDDRPCVVDMWNDLGLPVFAVADQRRKF